MISLWLVYTCGTCVLICFEFLTLLQQNAAHVLEVLMVLLYSLKSAEQISLYNDEEATEPKIQASWKVLIKRKGGISSYDATAYCILIVFWLYKWCRYDHTHINHIDHIMLHHAICCISCFLFARSFLKIPRQVKLEYVHRFEGGDLKSFANFTSTCWEIHLKSFHWHLLLNYSYLMSSLYSTPVACVWFSFACAFFWLPDMNSRGSYEPLAGLFFRVLLDLVSKIWQNLTKCNHCPWEHITMAGLTKEALIIPSIVRQIPVDHAVGRSYWRGSLRQSSRLLWIRCLGLYVFLLVDVKIQTAPIGVMFLLLFLT